MQVKHQTQPLLYNQYRADRLIDDNAAGHSDPDVSLTIAPNSVQVIYEVQYLAARKFKLQNRGTESIEWGLSDDADTATNPLTSLAANSLSERLSTTLAPSGAYLLVRNSSNVAIDLELSIIE